MATIAEEIVLDVQHWNDSLFSFRTTRDASFRFRTGQFVMVGLPVEGRNIMRAYSIASANYEEHLEFFSIKVPNGPLTSRLQHIQPGDRVLLSRKPTGTLVLDHLNPGKTLWMLSTGTGLAPFMGLIRDPEVYERFDKVVLVHGVRRVNDLAYRELITMDLPQHPYLGEQISKQLLYYPTVTREPFEHEGRITTLIENNKLTADLGLPPMNPETDRVMICGNTGMLQDLQEILDARGFIASPGVGETGDYVFERAFVEAREPAAAQEATAA